MNECAWNVLTFWETVIWYLAFAVILVGGIFVMSWFEHIGTNKNKDA